MQKQIEIRTSKIWSEIAFATRLQQSEKRKFLIEVLEDNRVTKEVFGRKLKIEPYSVLINIDDAKKYGLVN